MTAKQQQQREEAQRKLAAGLAAEERRNAIDDLLGASTLFVNRAEDLLKEPVPARTAQATAYATIAIARALTAIATALR